MFHKTIMQIEVTVLMGLNFKKAAMHRSRCYATSLLLKAAEGA